MSGAGAQLQSLESFIETWRAVIEQHANAVFHCATLNEDYRAPHTIADEFINGHGFKPIGFNWEMLDAAPEADGERAALQVISKALARNVALPQQIWLGDDAATRCAEELLACFDPVHRTVLSNHFAGLWNPIAGAAVEWAFVAMDDRAIALLLVTPKG